MSKGSQIKKRREELGYSQTEFAEMVSLSKQTLFKYENDIITNIPSDKIERIATALRVSPAYIMGWDSQREEIPYVKPVNPPVGMQVPYLKTTIEVQTAAEKNRIERALEFYNIYEQAPQNVRETIDMILKSSQRNP